MKQDEARYLVSQTFTHSFSEEQFIGFVRNLLPGMQPASTRTITNAQLPQGFREHVHSYTRIGTYHDPIGDVLDVVVVKLNRQDSLDRARTRQRNLMAHYLKTRSKDAVLVAYIGDDPSDWRFSFVKLAYHTEIADKGTVKVKKEFTPVRRYSFLVGKHEPNHTAQKQLGDLLMKEGGLTLTQIEEAFNIESITKEFFEDYKALFLQIKENLDQIINTNQMVKAEFDRCEINTANFAKKLLGQIVFLYFLQKKGWLGVTLDQAWGTGDKKFLSSLFDENKDKNFFDEILEPFFYEALANERKDDYYSTLKCKVPFLNGGLFEPLNGYNWDSTHINLENKIFEKVFNVFNLYNFTVREDEPLEKEVAVDPEMLGKVFENLLEVKDRKSKGAFYTPREIVHYMCQESLINYLDTILNTEGTKIPKIDIESFIREGDFSFERDQAREEGKLEGDDYGLPESIREYAKEIDFVLAYVKICDPAIGSGAFPVGMMTEIVRSRRILTPYLSNPRKRDTYALKWHCIENSLYGVDIDAGAVEIAKLRLWLSLVVDEESYDEIRPLPNLDYRIVCGNSLFGVDVKDKFFQWMKFQTLEQKKNQYFSVTSHRNKEVLREEIDVLINELTEGKKIFDFEVYFSEVFSTKNGFDIVIGNPPYGVSVKGKERKHYINKLGKVPDYEIYYFFIQISRALLKPYGIKSYIIPNTFLFNVFATEYRKKLLDEWSIKLIVDCTAFKLFASATVYNAITVFQKTKPQDGIIGYKQTANANSFIELANRPTSYISKDELLVNNTNWGLAFKLPEKVLRTITKIRTGTKKLEVFFPEISQGLIAYDKYTGQNQQIIETRAFHYREKTKPELREWLWGQDITPFRVVWNGQEYIDYCSGIANPRKPKYFKGKRVLIREITNPKIFAGYSEKEQYHDPSIIVVLDNKNKIFPLLGILNSNLATFFHFNASPKATKGAFPKILVKDIKEFPLPDWSSAQEIEPYVSKIIKLVNDPDYDSDKQSQEEVKRLEEEINIMVYQLYGLTKEDIEIIEESVGK